MAKRVSKTIVNNLVKKINAKYEIGGQSYAVYALDGAQYNGSDNWYIVVDVAGLDAIEVSMNGPLCDFAHDKGVSMEPVNSGLLGIYHI